MNFQRKSLAIAIMVATSTLSACSSDSTNDIAAEVEEVIAEEVIAEEVISQIPTEITLSNLTVDENNAGAEVATISTGDVAVSDVFSFTTDNENFVVSGTTLSLAPDYSIDFETASTVTFNIIVSDNASNTYTQAVTIEVNDVLETYTFLSKVGDETASSVSYGGQTARHALIAELKNYIGSDLQSDLDNGSLTTKAQVIEKLNSYYDATEESWDGFEITFTDAKQTFFNEISSSYKSIKDKVAGNDASGQHKLWNGEKDDAGNFTGENIAFAGWGDKGSITPDGLIQSFFNQLADIAIDNLGSIRTAPNSSEEIPVYVTASGTDLNQLIQKFLLMSVAYSQATDDYLDENKGLAADNIAGDKDGTKAYTALEHQFDEGFGYFGAARDYLAYNDNEISGKVSSNEDGRSDWNGEHDTDGDGKIDLLSEINLGNSVNAAKRDRGSKNNDAATDYTKEAMEAFIAGRNLINVNSGMALTDDQKTELLTYRDTAVNAWEKSVAATVVHYINELNSDLERISTSEFSFSDTAKHFSELKGFALGLQFNPYSPITNDQFEEFHMLVQDEPVLVEANVADYQADLIKARDILQSALGFDTDNVVNW